MTTAHKEKPIEVALPLEALNAAARRAPRTGFMGAAPTTRNENLGRDDKRIE